MRIKFFSGALSLFTGLSLFSFVSLLSLSSLSASAATPASISSPNGNIKLEFKLDNLGAPLYSISYNEKTLVADSKLGLVGSEAEFISGFSIASVDTTSSDTSWTPVWGEYASVRDNHREMAVKLVAPNPERLLTIRFRLFDDGVGFRYELPLQDKVNYLTLMAEKTEFRFCDDHTLFCIPGDYDTDEYLWSETSFSSLPEALASYAGHSEAQRAGGAESLGARRRRDGKRTDGEARNGSPND